MLHRISWPFYLLAGVVLVILLALGTGIWFVRRPFPKVRGQLSAPGLSHKVEIFRDEDGVPHIWASTSKDLYFAQGYVHAQDRFWQMDFWRRIGQGRLSEWLGEDLVESDKWLRTMGFARAAEKQLAQTEEPYLGWLEAYSAGINAYISSRKPSRLGLEFAFLNLTGVDIEIEPWEPVHTITWGNVMASTLGGNLSVELQNLDLLRGVGRNLLTSWAAPYRKDMPVIVEASELALFRQVLGIEAPGGGSFAQNQSPPQGGGKSVGSNNWVISPQLSPSGNALLANDMHLAPQMPSIWHEIGLHLVPPAGSEEEEMTLRGFQFPGVPGVTAGQNSHFAWGHTNLGGDVQDLFIEKIDPENPNRYLAGTEWTPMVIRQEEIKVLGREEPLIHQTRFTRHGPLITDLPQYRDRASFIYEGKEADPRHLVYTELSLSWTIQEENLLVESIFDLNRSRNFNEFREALRKWGVPGQNVVYADKEGNIGYQATGYYPRRPAHQGQGPVPGWDDDFSWTEPIPFDQLPGAYNPPKGYIVSANNLVIDPGYPYYIGKDFANGLRARQIAGRIEEYGRGIGVEEMASIQGDVYSREAEETLPYFMAIDLEQAIDSWWDKKMSKETGPFTRREKKKLAQLKKEESLFLFKGRDLLARWDRRYAPESPGAAAYGFVWKRMLEETLKNKLSDELWPPAWFNQGDNTFYYLLNDPQSPWWDDPYTPEYRESRDDILARALIGGLQDARTLLGKKVQKWTWGENHRVSFRNASLGSSGIPLLEKIFNRGPFPAPGGNSQVSAHSWMLDPPFQVRGIPSERAVYNPANPSASIFIHTPGQSGHPFHKHYNDYIEPWLKEEYHPGRWTREEVEASAGRRRLILNPS